MEAGTRSDIFWFIVVIAILFIIKWIASGAIIMYGFWEEKRDKKKAAEEKDPDYELLDIKDEDDEDEDGDNKRKDDIK